MNNRYTIDRSSWKLIPVPTMERPDIQYYSWTTGNMLQYGKDLEEYKQHLEALASQSLTISPELQEQWKEKEGEVTDGVDFHKMWKVGNAYFFSFDIAVQYFNEFKDIDKSITSTGDWLAVPITTTANESPITAEKSGEHWSDCATNNEPAELNGECDCRAAHPVEEEPKISHINIVNEYLKATDKNVISDYTVAELNDFALWVVCNKIPATTPPKDISDTFLSCYEYMELRDRIKLALVSTGLHENDFSCIEKEADSIIEYTKDLIKSPDNQTLDSMYKVAIAAAQRHFPDNENDTEQDKKNKKAWRTTFIEGVKLGYAASRQSGGIRWVKFNARENYVLPEMMKYVIILFEDDTAHYGYFETLTDQSDGEHYILFRFKDSEGDFDRILIEDPISFAWLDESSPSKEKEYREALEKIVAFCDESMTEIKVIATEALNKNTKTGDRVS